MILAVPGIWPSANKAQPSSYGGGMWKLWNMVVYVDQVVGDGMYVCGNDSCDIEFGDFVHESCRYQRPWTMSRNNMKQFAF